MEAVNQMDAGNPVIVVGAGIAGIACARTLAGAGVAVRVVDRGRRPGGRMAVDTVDGRPVDIGASYFTVSDPRFEVVVGDWAERGLARPWTDTFQVLEDTHIRTTTGPMRWAAGAGLRALVEDLADGLDVQVQDVSEVGPGPTVDGRPARAVVLAMPDPQARRLVAPGLVEEVAALDHATEPVLVLSAGWSRRAWADDLDGMFVHDDEQLSWIADDGRRRGDGAPVLVAHSTPAFAAAHLDSPQQATAPMLAALSRILVIETQPRWTDLHRWTYARPAQSRESTFFLGDSGIGACGDGWSAKPRVEAAYLSGVDLAEAMITRLA